MTTFIFPVSLCVCVVVVSPPFLATFQTASLGSSLSSSHAVLMDPRCYSLRRIRTKMSLSPCDNVKNLRVRPEPGPLSQRTPVWFLAGTARTRVPFLRPCRRRESRCARSSRRIPLTILYSAAREPRPLDTPPAADWPSGWRVAPVTCG